MPGRMRRICATAPTLEIARKLKAETGRFDPESLGLF